jgi:catalase
VGSIGLRIEHGIYIWG